MKRATRIGVCLLVAGGLAAGAGWAAKPEPAGPVATGTLDAAGLHISVNHLHARRYADPERAHHYIVELIFSDRELGPWNRQRVRLVALSRLRRLHALRVIWYEGRDQLIVTPFDERIAASEQPHTGIATIDVRYWTGPRLQARIRCPERDRGWGFDVDVVIEDLPIEGGFEPEPTPGPRSATR